MAASECIHTHMQLYLSAQILMSFSHSIIQIKNNTNRKYGNIFVGFSESASDRA